MLRSALALSLLTQRPFEIENLRRTRPQPGLLPQHLACVRAAQAIAGGGAHARHADLGSERLLFEPAEVRAGDYLLDIGTSGAVSLLLQAISVPLSSARAPSTLRLRGGTHVALSPSFHYLSLVWLPAMRELGYELELELRAAGYHPEGGGEVTVNIRPANPAVPFDRRNRGMLREASVLSVVSNLPFEVASRQSERVLTRLREKGIAAEAENLPVPSARSRGSMCLVVGSFEHARVGFSVLGEIGKPAERVGDEAASAFCDFMKRRGAVDRHLADQLLLPLALASAGLQGGERPVSWFSTECVTRHLVTQAKVIGQFLDDVEVVILANPGDEGDVRVAPRGESLMSALRTAVKDASSEKP